MKIYYLPLEKLETRYTCEWYSQFKEVFEEEGIDYEYINGDKITSKLKGKYFLDPISTNIYKLSQLNKLLKKIDKVKDDDVIFFPDLWFPGIEVLAYIKHFTNKKFKIVGILHAGTYDINDLTYQAGMGYFGKNLEEAWFSFVDKIFVATNYHKNLILKNRIVDKSKIVVTGLPVDINKLKGYQVEKLGNIIFTGRRSVEKGVDIALKFKDELKYPIKIALDLNLTKNNYYKLLGKNKVVFAPSKQETFGYGVVEGMCMGCIPVVPDKLSFREIVPKRFRYSKVDDIEVYINRALNCSINLFKYVKRFEYRKVIKRMIKEC